MKNKKKKGFTLVELLAVIVILAVILVIAVPQILNTINSSRYAAIKSSAELLLNQAEKQYMTDQALSANTGNDLESVVYGGITTLASGATKLCTELTELNPNDYDTCKITVTNDGVATLNELTGKGKFNGYTCTGTKNNVTCDGPGGSGSSGGNNSGTSGGGASSSSHYALQDPVYSLDVFSIGEEIPSNANAYTGTNAIEEVIASWSILMGGETSGYPFYIIYTLDANEKVKDRYIGWTINDNLKATWKEDYCSNYDSEWQADEKMECEAKYDNLVNGNYALKYGMDSYETNVEEIKTAINYSARPDACYAEEDSDYFACNLGEAFNVGLDSYSVNAWAGGWHCNVYESSTECTYQ